MTTAPHETMHFPTERALLRKLPVAMVLCLGGLVALAFDAPSVAQALAAFALTWGLATIAVVLIRQIVPAKPRLALLPEGVYLRLSWDGETVVPWSQITAVDLVTTYQSYYHTTVRDWSDVMWAIYLNMLPLQQPHVTALVVSQSYYDAQVRPRVSWLPFPGWNAEFIHTATNVQIALPHEPLWISPRAMHDAVLSRWLASTAPSTAAPPRDPTTLPDTIRISTRVLEYLKLALPLIGIAVLMTNLAGAWQTPKQRAVRQQQEQTASEQAKRKAEQQRRDDELDRLFTRPRGRP